MSDNVFNIIRTLTELEFVTKAQYLIPLGTVDTMSYEELVMEDEFALFAGKFAVTLASKQLRRFAWMFGYPYMFSLMLGTPEEGEQVTTSFESDLALSRKF